MGNTSVSTSLHARWAPTPRLLRLLVVLLGAAALALLAGRADAATPVTWTGTLTFDDGSVLDGASLSLHGSTSDFATVASDGSFSLTVDAGTYQVSLNWFGPGGEIGVSDFNFDVNADLVQDITIPTLDIAVDLDKNGAPFDGASVNLSGDTQFSAFPGLDFQGYSAATGTTGTGATPGRADLRSTPLPTGSTLYVYPGNGDPNQTFDPGALTTDQTIAFTLVDPVTFSGFVLDGVGGGIGGANLSLYNGSGSAHGYTNPDGSFSISLIPGIYDLRLDMYVDNSSITASIGSFDLSADHFQVFMIPFGPIDVTIDSGGVPTAGASVSLNGQGTIEVSPGVTANVSVGGYDQTDSSGVVEFTSTDLDALTIDVWHAGVYQQFSEGATTVPASFNYTIASTSTPGTITGRVFDDASGNGSFDANEATLPGITVQITDGQGSTTSDTTDADGIFEFTGLAAPADYDLRVRSYDHDYPTGADRATVSAPANGTATHDVPTVPHVPVVNDTGAIVCFDWDGTREFSHLLDPSDGSLEFFAIAGDLQGWSGDTVFVPDANEVHIFGDDGTGWHRWVFDATTGAEVSKNAVGYGTAGAQLAADGDLLVAEWDGAAEQLLRVAPATQTASVVGQIGDLAYWGTASAYDPGTDRWFASGSNGSTDKLYVLDASTGALLADHPVGEIFQRMWFAPHGQVLALSNPGPGSFEVVAIDPATGVTTPFAPLPGLSGMMLGGEGAIDLVASQLHVVGLDSNWDSSVWTVDLDTATTSPAVPLTANAGLGCVSTAVADPGPSDPDPLGMVAVANWHSEVDRWCEASLGIWSCEDLDTFSGAAWATVSADLDNDGDGDVIATGRNGRLRICLWDTGWTCSSMPVGTTRPNGLDLGDLDGDGDLDVVVAQSGGGGRVCLGDGAGGFATCSALPNNGSDYFDVELADFTGDGHLDAVFANWSARSRLCRGDGAGGFTKCKFFDAGKRKRTLSVDSADVDHDGDIDLVTAVAQTRQNRICLNDGIGNFSCSNISSAARYSRSISAVDLDHDGHPDLVISNGADPTEVCLGAGDGSFSCTDVDAGARITLGVDVGDVDDDGNVDFVSASFRRAGSPAGAGTNRVCLGAGDGTFSCQDLGTDDYSSNDIAIVVNP